MIATIQSRLFALQDLQYKAFQLKLTPGINSDSVIGVRMPALRALAREFATHPCIGEFLATLPHRYYEEILLHGMLIGTLRDYDQTLREVDRLLPYIDNWATCDTLKLKAFKSPLHHEQLLTDIRRWLASPAPFTVRFGLSMLMTHFLDAEFRPEFLGWAAAVTLDHYYVRMMVAWYFATALAKQWDSALLYLQEPRLARWTHNKTLQKAIESYRISPEQKEYLRTLRL